MVHDDLIITPTVRIPRREIETSFGPSGGPGGQHANRSHTRVEVRVDLTSSAAFSPEQRRRVVRKLGAEARIVADDERSQTRNRALAEERLAARIRDALRVEPTRRPTKPTRGSQRRRVEAKQRRGELKRQRRRPRSDD